MNNNGWIKIHRQIIDWEWYSDIPTCRLFLHLLLIANHAPKKWQGQTIDKGELITSIGSLSEQTGLTIQQVRTAISKLESTGEIEKTSTNKNTLIKVRNYGIYQGFDEYEQQTNNKQITNEQQTNNNKQEYKELKNERNISSSSAHVREKFLLNCPNVLLTDEQADKLLEELSLEEFHLYMEKLEAYIVSGHRVSNPYQTIMKFAREDRQV